MGPAGNQGKASTYQVTYEMYQRGLAVEEIARKRQMGVSTIYSHLAILYEQGYDIALEEMVSPAEVDKVLKSLRYLQEPYKLKDIYDYLGEQGRKSVV